jgi:hypothetical protein
MSIQTMDNDTPALPVEGARRILLPFFGGSDDRAALRIALQMAENPTVELVVAHFQPVAADRTGDSAMDWGFEESAPEDSSLIAALAASLPASLGGRVSFSEVSVTTSAAPTEVVQLARSTVGISRNAGDLVIVGRRHAAFVDNSQANAEMKKALGLIAEKVATSGIRAEVLVIQATGRGA